MSSKTTNKWITGLEGNIMKMMEEIEWWSLHFDGPMFSSPKSKDVNVLPSVSNPASKTSPLSDREWDLPPVPPTKSHMVLSHIKPANPSKFSGNRTKGHAFLNSCNLYFALTPRQFTNDHVKIMWAFSFMKNEQAVHFVDRKMWMYDVVGSLIYVTWQEFVLEFVAEFCPKNEVQTLRTDLETATYLQGSCTIDKYINSFRVVVDKARYFEGAHIVLKFCQGLNAKIQDYVACLTQGRPSDKIPQQWYDAMILCDENFIANAAFTSSPQTLRQSNTPPLTSGILQKPTTTFTRTYPISTLCLLPVPSVSSAQRPKDTTAIMCFRCGQPGHLQPDCPKRFDICYLSLEEWQAFAEDKFAALDVHVAHEGHNNMVEESCEDKAEEAESGFGMGNKWFVCRWNDWIRPHFIDW
jgi:Retrotransposon gag protein/Zinc knuckle